MVTEVVEIVVKERGAIRTANQINRVGAASKTAAGSVRLLGVALASLATGLAARAMLDFADTAIRVENQIKTVTNGTEEFLAVQQQLIAAANETRAPLDDTTAIYKRLRTATRDLGVSQQSVLDVTRGLNAAIVVSGATSQEASSALRQLAQGLGSGRFAGDELRSVMENLTPVAQALADELGVGVGELRSMGAAGKLNAETVYPALINVAAKFERELGNLDFTVGQTANVLKTAFITTVGEINKVLGATRGVNAGIIAFSKNIRTILITSIAGLIQAFGSSLRVISSVAFALDSIGIEVLPSLGQSFRIFGQAVLLVLEGIVSAVTFLEVQMRILRTTLAFIGRALGLVELDTLNNELTKAEGALERLTASQNRAADAGGALFDTLLEVAGNEGIAKTAEGFLLTADAADELAEKLRQLQTAAAAPINVDLTTTTDPKGGGGDGLTEEERDRIEKLSDTMASSVTGAFTDAFDGILQGEGFNFAESLADLSSDLFQQGMEEVLSGLTDSLSELLEGAGSSLGGLGALAGIGGSLLAGALASSDSQVSRSGVGSAVTSTVAQRGVVAGQSSIPILEVSDRLEDAFVDTNGLLEQILSANNRANALLDAILSTSGSATAAGTMATTTPTLA